MALTDHIHFIHPQHVALKQIATYLIGQIPSADFSDCQILLPDSRLASGLRQALLDTLQEKGKTALLGPQFYTLESWLSRFLPDTAQLCSEQVRLLILVEALNHAPHLLGQASAWSLADDLLQLFDELTLQRIELDSDISDFQQQLARWYQTGSSHFSGLRHEAELIHHLWQAWHQQLSAQNLLDSSLARLAAMRNSLQHTHHALHIIGFEPRYAAEAEWLTQITQQKHVHLWWQGQPCAAIGAYRHEAYLYRRLERQGLSQGDFFKPEPYSDSLNQLFATQPAFALRARQQARDYPESPLEKRISIFSADSSEQHSAAIDTQIRQWLLQGKQRIGVICEDRLLARRLRALLERADVALQDAVGWTMSTTRAAATIESLLLCIEQDFEKDALLDLLKSGQLSVNRNRPEFAQAIYRFENDILNHEKITNHLPRYIQAIADRSHRLKDYWPCPPQDLAAIFEELHEASRPLCALQEHRHAPVETYIATLKSVMQALGLIEGLNQDAAGEQLLLLLDEMQTAARSQNLQADWAQFRAWLARNLERRYFQPERQNSAVQLLSLAQCGFMQFDALIIAGMEATSFPGPAPLLPFFNNQIRKQLALPDIEQFHEQRLHQFYTLLHSADTILLTHRRQQDGDIILASAWLNALQEFHKNAYANELAAEPLQMLLNSQSTEVIRCDTLELPEPQTAPRPAVTAELLPPHFSAHRYQQLMDCPYQFYAAQCLQLQAPEEIQQALSKREYGERLHLCLQAFHSDVSSLPGPCPDALTPQNRQTAIELLEAITQAVFHDDLAINFMHRGWLYQWRQVIPEYIDWLIKERSGYRVIQTEQELTRTVNEYLTLRGRIDRIDRGADQTYEVIDYKSGSLPSKKAIESGEKIQLAFYASLASDAQSHRQIDSVGYISLGSENRFKPSFPLAHSTLHELAEHNLQRLVQLSQQLHEGQAMPAWESDEACRYCDMTCLCRRGSWNS